MGVVKSNLLTSNILWQMYVAHKKRWKKNKKKKKKKKKKEEEEEEEEEEEKEEKEREKERKQKKAKKDVQYICAFVVLLKKTGAVSYLWLNMLEVSYLQIFNACDIGKGVIWNRANNILLQKSGK